MKRTLVIDALGIAGLAALVEGAREIYRPAAFVVAGLLLVGMAWLLSGGRE